MTVNNTGNDSPNGNAMKGSNEDGAAPKKKRMRVGDVKKQSFDVNADRNNKDRNPYRNSNNDYRQAPNRYSDNNREGDYNSNRSYRQPNRDERGGYNSFERNRESYNNNRRSSTEGGYNNNRGNGNGNYNQQNRRPSAPREAVKRLVKPVKYKENIDPNTPIRLNKYLANAGVCSRREADGYITTGVVKVNGEVVTELGVKVKRGDMVTFHEQPVRLESKVYVLLNKPKNCVTTSDDPENRLTVMDLVKNACPERIYPVGRLDRNTTGVLLLTNDGDLASKLTHPKFMKKKIYQVTLDKNVAIEDMQTIADGIELDDGEIHADSIAYQSEDVLDVVGIEIHSGRNRIVRRIFEKLGYHVIKLDRVLFAGLTKKNVPRGKWRYLSEKEVNMLRMGAFE